MKNTEQRRPWILTAGLWLVLIAVGVYYTWFRNTEHTNPTADTDSQIQTAPEPKPIRYPIELPKAETDTQTIATTSPQPPPEPPLPKLFESDQRVLELLHQSIDNESLLPVLIPQHIIARVVTTIDNLTPAKLATNALPVKPVPGAIQVKHMTESIFPNKTANVIAPTSRCWKRLKVQISSLFIVNSIRCFKSLTKTWVTRQLISMTG